MATKLDWDKANQKPARVLSWKEQRLDRAADNWIATQSLDKRPLPQPPPTPPPTVTKKQKRKQRKCKR
jgi:hypothetical protein